MSDFITIKDCFYLALGLALGLIFGIAIYWLPLGQFRNEIKALSNLISKRYNRNNQVNVRAGTDLKPVGFARYPQLLTVDTMLTIWHDEGVNWFHTPNGWKRVRVLHVFNHNDGENHIISKICHLDILS